MDYETAVAYLERHRGYGIRPGLETICGLLAILGDPHRRYPVIHVAGTNGKTTTVRMVADLLGAHGLTVGTFVSPHLHHVEERFGIGGATMTRDRLAVAVADVAPFADLYEQHSEHGITYFELTTAVAFEAFAGEAVDVAVVEVGLGGRLDATNVVEAAVSVITGVARDHVAYLGETLREIGAEKAAILKREGTLVTGKLGPEAESAAEARVREEGARWLRTGIDFAVEDVELSPQGWRFSIDGIYDRYEDLELHLHGRHQVDHMATATATCEAFFERALDPAAVTEAAAAVTSPGRLEIVRERPLILVDGAHNEQGFAGLAQAIDTEITGEHWVLVIGVREGRDPGALAEPLLPLVDRVVVTAAADPSAIVPERVAAALADIAPEDLPIEIRSTVADALARATELAGSTGSVVVAGSLYVVGEARIALGLARSRSSSPAHHRFEADPHWFLGSE